MSSEISGKAHLQYIDSIRHKRNINLYPNVKENPSYREEATCV